MMFLRLRSPSRLIPMKLVPLIRALAYPRLIMITNKKGHLTKKDIECMVQEAEQFSSEDESQRMCIGGEAKQ